MADRRWIGGARKVAQVIDYVLSGTWVSADVITFTIGNVSATTTAGSTTITTILDNLVAAWNALSADNYPAFAEITASDDNSTKFKLTADTAGKPIACTISTNSALGLIDGATSSTGTTSTANSGPNDWSVADNWSGDTVPVNSDNVYLDNSIDILYGLAQSGVTLTSLTIPPSFGTAKVGLPQHNGSYAEYRADYLAISTTTLNVECDSGRMKINLGTAVSTINVYKTGRGVETGLKALIVKGTHASNVLNVFGGEVDVAPYGGETATIVTMRVGYQGNQASSADVRLSSGVTLTTVTMFGGDLEINGAFTTLNSNGGTVVINGSGAVTTLNGYGGHVHYVTSGTLTALNLYGPVWVDFTGDPRTKTVTTTDRYDPSAKITDKEKVVTWTNGIDLNGSGSLVNLDLGNHLKITPAAVS